MIVDFRASKNFGKFPSSTRTNIRHVKSLTTSAITTAGITFNYYTLITYMNVIKIINTIFNLYKECNIPVDERNISPDLVRA